MANDTILVEGINSTLIVQNDVITNVISNEINNTVQDSLDINNIVSIFGNTITQEIKEELVVVSGQAGPPGINEEDMTYSKRVDFISDNLLYKGEADVGTLTTSPGWRVRRITLGNDGDVTEEWADGDALFNNIWDNRTILTYI